MGISNSKREKKSKNTEIQRQKAEDNDLAGAHYSELTVKWYTVVPL